MKNKRIALITGGTSGVGLSIVKGLLQNGYFAVFIGSNSSRGKLLEQEFNRKTPASAAFVCLDLSNLKEVSRFANEFTNTYPRLDVLVNSAGVILPQRTITPEGFEKTFAIGYLSAVILCTRLAPLLGQSVNGRIVNVAGPAKTILNYRLDVHNLDFSKAYNGFKASVAAVHAKTVMTQLLAEKLSAQGITVNSFHPGVIRSGLTRHLNFFMRAVTLLFSPLMKTSSDNGIFAATAEELKSVTGQLLVNKKPVALKFELDYKEKLWLITNSLPAIGQEPGR